MDEWRRRMPTPHLATTIPHYHGLDFGRTMPLRHPPATAQARSNIGSSPQSFLPFSRPLAPLPIPVASRELPISPSSSLSGSSQIQAPSSETARAQNSNVEKKRWQTANYRWMFTKRKGNKLYLLLNSTEDNANMADSAAFTESYPTSFAILTRTDKLDQRHVFCIFTY